MDRHDYVKELIKERDSLSESISDLNKKVAKAKKRTKEAVLEFGENRYGEICSVNMCGSAFYGEVKFPENEMVSDEAIKKLHKEIFDLETRQSSLRAELADLESRDFVSHLKGLINES